VESKPDIDVLERCLAEGMAGTERNDPRELFHLAPEVEDREVARYLVRQLAAAQLAEAGAEKATERASTKAPPAEESVGSADSSFLGVLATSGTAGISVDRIDDVATLLAVLRAGSRKQRRAALARLGERLLDRKSLPSETSRVAMQTLLELRDVELGYELAEARAALPGGAGRTARNEGDEWTRLAARTETRIRDYWDGRVTQEPILQLPADQRGHLLMRVRDLRAASVDHISAIIEGGGEAVSRDDRSRLVASLRYASDPRLLPALISVIDSERGDLLINAARVVGGVDDPRAHPALAERFERTVVTEERIALGAALGMHGDCRSIGEVRDLLSQDQPPHLLLALEAAETLGSPEDAELVTRFLADADLAVSIQAARTLGRIADGRVLDELTSQYNATSVPALRATIEDALSAIAARMELRGEEAIEVDWAEVGNKPATRAGERDRLSAVFRGWKDYFVGRLWLILGRLKRAIARFEAASARRAGWAVPLIAIGMAFSSRGQYALALPAFRRALELDRTRIERNPILVRAMAKSFLHRAEEVEREGREDVARGLVGEVLTLDLRRAPGTVRLELKRLQEDLRREEYRNVGTPA
jgi:tetratricopeptide (TPR) repeat protein